MLMNLVMNALIPFAMVFGMYAIALKKYYRYDAKQNLILMAIVVGIVMSASYLLTFLPAPWQEGSVFVVCYFILVIAAVLMVFRVSITKATFLFFVIKCYLDDAFTLAKIIQVYVIDQMFRTDEAMEFVLAYALILILTYPLMIIFMRNSVRELMEIGARMSFWRYIWMVPCFFYLVYKFGISPNYSNVYQIMDSTKVFLPVIWVIGSTITGITIVHMLTSVAAGVTEREQVRMLSWQMGTMQEQYTRLQSSIESTRQMRHDMRHVMALLKECLDRGDYSQMADYLRAYQGHETLMKSELKVCENYAVNAMAGHYIQMAKENQIHIEYHLEIGAKINYIELDICMIIGNLLENAIEACMLQTKGKPYIIAKAGMRGNVLGIIVENSYERPVKKEANTFLSSKRNGAGIGITSVESIAQKYSGIAKFEYTKDVFTASILLPAKGV